MTHWTASAVARRSDLASAPKQTSFMPDPCLSFRMSPVVKGFGCRPLEGRRRLFGGRRPKASKGGNRAGGRRTIPRDRAKSRQTTFRRSNCPAILSCQSIWGKKSAEQHEGEQAIEKAMRTGTRIAKLVSFAILALFTAPHFWIWETERLPALRLM